MGQDIAALRWVSGELEQTADRLSKALLAFADNVSDHAQLRLGLTQAHQLHATLRMLELPSAEQLAREVEETLQAILNGRVPASEPNLQTLLAASIQLPAYLRRIVVERRESPLEVLELINELRFARDEPALPAPPPRQWIGTEELAHGCGEGEAEASEAEMQALRVARERLQAELPFLQRREAVAERLHNLADTFAAVAPRLRPGGHRVFWQACAALAEALEGGGLAPDEEAIGVLRDLDGELGSGTVLGRGFYRRAPDEWLYRRLLGLLARSRPVSPLLVEIQTRHHLVPDAGRAAGTTMRADLGATNAVVAVLDEDLRKVLQQLEAAEGDAFGIARVLREVEPELRRIVHVLAGLGYREEFDVLQPQIVRIEGGLMGTGAELDDRLTEISAALLDVEQRLGERALASEGQVLPEGTRRHPFDRAVAAVCREVRDGLEQVKQAVGDYIASGRDVQLFNGMPDRLHAMQGALRLAGLGAAAGILADCRDHLSAVLRGERAGPDVRGIDAFADALICVEYFLERLVTDRVPSELILARSRDALTRLVALAAEAPVAVQAPAVEEVPALAEELLVPEEVPVAVEVPEPELVEEEAPAEALPEEWLPEVAAAELVEEVPVAAERPEPVEEELPVEELPLAAAVAVEPPDAEIVEIFTEEAAEVLETVAAQFPLWVAAPGGGAPLAELRRAFHTLKGSGRMVGAEQLGELAWGVEQLLNRVIDGTVAASADVVEVVDRARALMPGLVEAFAGHGRVDEAAVGLVRSAADALVRGEAPPWAAVPEVVVPVLEEAVPVEEVPLAAELPVPEEVALPEEVAVPEELPLAAELVEEAVPPVEEVPAPEEEAAVPEEVPLAAELPEPEPELVEEEAPAEVLPEEWLPEVAAAELVEEVPTPAEAVAVPEEEVPLAAELPEPVEEELPVAEAEPLPEEVEPLAAAAAEIVEPDLQMRLRVIFREELGEHLHSLAAYLAGEWRGTITQGLLRTLHTLRGSSRAAGNEALVLVLEPLEAVVQHAKEAGRAVTAAELSLLERLCALISLVRETELQAGREISAAAEQLRALVLECAGAPERAIAPPVDTRMTRFLLECLEKLFHATRLLEEWRQGRDIGAQRALLGELRAIELRAEQLGVAAVLQIARPLLTALTPAAMGTAMPSGELFGLASEAFDAALDVMDRLAAGQLPDTRPELIVRLRAAAGVVPRQPVAPSPAEADVVAEQQQAERQLIASELQQVEQELLSTFIEEADELMVAIDGAIDSWRQDRANRASFDYLKRYLHTLKGGARMAGLKHLGELSHDFETFLLGQDAHFGEVDDGFFEQLADYYEQLLRTMDIVKALPAAGPEALAAAARQAPAAAEAPQGEAAEGAAAPKPRDEVVRVSAQLLEHLVNLAGETSIARGRAEEQVTELGHLFEDMQSAIERLQSQVRRLDIATEAQVLFRRERADAAGLEGFDPLELDRYSQLQQLSRSLVESASDLLDIRRTLADKTRDLETVLLQQKRINTQLQEGLMRSRMVPFSSILPRLKRVVRQVAGELHKQVDLEMGNLAGELDRGVLERVLAPLEHMLRNAVDHGIEPPERRRACGKPETGLIRIEVSREGGDVLISVSDDGAGVNLAAVKAKAIERGLMDPAAPLGERELVQFILHPGFSTATKVTQISGRGVGMDVVSSEIRQMGGSLEIHNEPGRGMRFSARLPFTVSVSRALLVAVGHEIYALPLTTVAGVVRMRVSELQRHAGPDASPFHYAGQSYEVRSLSNLLFLDEPHEVVTAYDTVPVVLVRGGGQALAVHVDRLVGAREIAVKSLGPQFGAVPGLSGATVLGDGSVVVILDVPAMLRADAAHGATTFVRAERPKQEKQVERPPLIMVVDDSVTVRKVTSRFLEREGMQVVTAKDGADAMLKLQEQVPDVMLLDIEMPHMDGFEVISKVRLSEELHDLPIIMITSRSGEKHRERALSLGANAYLGKPYQESVLLEQIQALLERRKDKA